MRRRFCQIFRQDLLEVAGVPLPAKITTLSKSVEYVTDDLGVRGWPQPFCAEDYFKGLARPCLSRFWRDKAGMFIHHCASANAVPILMRT